MQVQYFCVSNTMLFVSDGLTILAWPLDALEGEPETAFEQPDLVDLDLDLDPDLASPNHRTPRLEGFACDSTCGDVSGWDAVPPDDRGAPWRAPAEGGAAAAELARSERVRNCTGHGHEGVSLTCLAIACPQAHAVYLAHYPGHSRELHEPAEYRHVPPRVYTGGGILVTPFEVALAPRYLYVLDSPESTDCLIVLDRRHDEPLQMLHFGPAGFVNIRSISISRDASLVLLSDTYRRKVIALQPAGLQQALEQWNEKLVAAEALVRAAKELATVVTAAKADGRHPSSPMNDGVARGLTGVAAVTGVEGTVTAKQLRAAAKQVTAAAATARMAAAACARADSCIIMDSASQRSSQRSTHSGIHSRHAQRGHGHGDLALLEIALLEECPAYDDETPLVRPVESMAHYSSLGWPSELLHDILKNVGYKGSLRDRLWLALCVLLAQLPHLRTTLSIPPEIHDEFWARERWNHAPFKGETVSFAEGQLRDSMLPMNNPTIMRQQTIRRGPAGQALLF